jgi:hypothetical protein
MKLTDDQIKDVSRYSGLNFELNEIAELIDVDQDWFISESTNENSEIAKALRRGKLLNSVEVKEKMKTSSRYLKEMAEVEREKEWQRMISDFFDLDDFKAQNVDRYKKVISLDQYSYNEIQAYRKTGQSEILVPEVQKYVNYLDTVAEIFPRTGGNINSTARKLMDKYPEDNLIFSTCKYIVYDAINFFWLNCDVQAKSWANYYAHQELPKLFLMAMKTGNLELAFQISKERMKVIQENNQEVIPEDVLKPHNIFINPDMNPERLGFTPHDLKDTWKDFQEFIDEYPIEKIEKDRIIDEVKIELNID